MNLDMYRYSLDRRYPIWPDLCRARSAARIGPFSDTITLSFLFALRIARTISSEGEADCYACMCYLPRETGGHLALRQVSRIAYAIALPSFLPHPG